MTALLLVIGFGVGVFFGVIARKFIENITDKFR